MTSPFNSLRGRFLFAVLLWVSLGTVAIGYSSIALFTKHVEMQFHEELEVHVRELADLAQLDSKGHLMLARPLSDPRYAVPQSGFYWQVTLDDRSQLKSASMTNGSLDASIAHSPNIIHRIASGPTGPTIAYGLQKSAENGEALHFVIATDQRHLETVITEFTQDLIPWLAVLACSLLASGVGVITFGLRPLSRLADAIADLRSGRSEILSGSYPSEIQPVIANLNSYAERNVSIVERARAQAANLAHSLRTPLAVVTDEAECMVEAGDTSGRAGVFLTEAERMQRQIDYHLARARSSGSRQIAGSRSELAAIVSPLITAMNRIYPDKNFIAAKDIETAPALACDPDDLNEILSNLLDNAGKWAVKTIWVNWRIDGRIVTISVYDDGPGIAESEIETVFDVGVRLCAEAKGSGLGLAIARDIVRDYGHDLILKQRQKVGLCAKLTLSTAHEYV